MLDTNHAYEYAHAHEYYRKPCPVYERPGGASRIRRTGITAGHHNAACTDYRTERVERAA